MAIDSNGYTFYTDVYAKPPIEEAEEAQRLGSVIERILDDADRQFSGKSLGADELDTFTPRQQESQTVPE
jgi:hypothetical protein